MSTMTAAEAPAAEIIDSTTSGNVAYIEVDAPAGEAGQEAAEEKAREHAETFCRRHRETYRCDDYWMVVWEIH